ncbi:MAG: thiol-disulfide isomerase [Gammaproteobacteria bacterium]|nr:thiol-disulfide isomerase [Gammaproteobacteria bacterium]
MAELIVPAFIVLWVLVLVLAVMVVALARQVGLLHERVAPAGALSPTSGPKVGELVEAATYPDLQGREQIIGGISESAETTLVLFVSPTCPVCKTLVPIARSLAQHEKLRLIFASDGDTNERHAAYVKDMHMENYPYIISQALGLGFGVSKLPFAVLLDATGTLVSKGLVNTREHLESLLVAMSSEVATLQDYIQSLDPGLKEQIQ